MVGGGPYVTNGRPTGRLSCSHLVHTTQNAHWTGRLHSANMQQVCWRVHNNTVIALLRAFGAYDAGAMYENYSMSTCEFIAYTFMLAE